MPITDLLERNARKYPNEVSLVEINPEIQEKRRVTWRDYELIESSPLCHYRREITWHVFDEKANRFAQLLLSRGIGKGDKVAILLIIIFRKRRTIAADVKQQTVLANLVRYLFHTADKFRPENHYICFRQI